MVSHKQWKRIFQIIIIVVIAAGISYLIFINFIYRSYTLPVSYTKTSAGGTVQGGNIQSTWYEDGDYLHIIAYGGNNIQLHFNFTNIIVNREYRIEIRLRSNVSSTHPTNTVIFFDGIPYKTYIYTLPTSFTVIETTAGIPFEENITVELNALAFADYLLEINTVRLYFIGMIRSEALFRAGMVVAIIGGTIGLYLYLAYRGVFVESDASRLVRKIKRKKGKLLKEVNKNGEEEGENDSRNTHSDM